MSFKFKASGAASIRPLTLACAIGAAVSMTSALPANAQGSVRISDRPDAVAVMVDQAKVIRLPEKTQTVIVGNPMIADISVQKNGILVVTGKSFGVTNFIALDAAGAMLAESRVTVRAATESVVTVQRGMERESYSCAPQCQPAIQLGDSSKFFGEVGGQATSRNQMASPQR
ncbi:MAG: pilus assembly protein N-terminal domain-containing protein [Bosea sp. (in: a-proteobacteria)]